MLEGLNDDIDNDQMPSDEELDGDDDPEMLAELERRQESLVEEFLEVAYAAKFERVEQLKNSFRGSKEISKSD
jgi:hypothetical protein